MIQYSVKKVATLSGVSIRTLHLYDEMGLLKPQTRTASRYRLYGETELLRLQQILFYKELDFSLQAIKDILDDPKFDVLQALAEHKSALQAKHTRIENLLKAIDTTLHNLKQGNMMLNNETLHEALYEGFPKETAETYRNEAIQEYGEEAVSRSYKALSQMSKAELAQLKSDQQANWEALRAMQHEAPDHEKVQILVAELYQIVRTFWGTAHLADKQATAFVGLGNMYVADERFTMQDGKPQPQFAQFLSDAMQHFADTSL